LERSPDLRDINIYSREGNCALRMISLRQPVCPNVIRRFIDRKASYSREHAPQKTGAFITL
jgi:hypothetical protein